MADSMCSDSLWQGAVALCKRRLWIPAESLFLNKRNVAQMWIIDASHLYFCVEDINIRHTIWWCWLRLTSEKWTVRWTPTNGQRNWDYWGALRSTTSIVNLLRKTRKHLYNNLEEALQWMSLISSAFALQQPTCIPEQAYRRTLLTN